MGFPRCNKIPLLFIQFGIIWFLTLATDANVEGAEDLWLEPTDMLVTAGSDVTFNCTMKCEHQNTHSMQWIVGDQTFQNRRVFLSYRSIFENRFHQQTGVRVTIEEENTCETGQPKESVKQTLSFEASSVEAMNRTAVQCVAIRKDRELLRDYLSYYSMLLVEGPASPDVPKQLSPSSVPTPSFVITAACPTKTQTEYSTIARTVYIQDMTDVVMLPMATPSPKAQNEAQTGCCCCQQIKCEME